MLYHKLLYRVQLIVSLLVVSLILNEKNSWELENTSIFHIVTVVSMLLVPTRVGSVSFQSKEVSGAQYWSVLF